MTCIYSTFFILGSVVFASAVKLQGNSCGSEKAKTWREAIDHGDENTVRQLLDGMKSFPKGLNLMHYAIDKNQQGIVELLVMKGSEPQDGFSYVMGKLGRLPPALWITETPQRRQMEDMAMLLLSLGASVDPIKHLKLAIFRNCEDLAKVIIHYTPADQRPYPPAFLQIAIEHGMVQVADRLIYYGTQMQASSQHFDAVHTALYGHWSILDNYHRALGFGWHRNRYPMFKMLLKHILRQLFPASARKFMLNMYAFAAAKPEVMPHMISTSLDHYPEIAGSLRHARDVIASWQDCDGVESTGDGLKKLMCEWPEKMLVDVEPSILQLMQHLLDAANQYDSDPSQLIQAAVILDRQLAQ